MVVFRIIKLKDTPFFISIRYGFVSVLNIKKTMKIMLSKSFQQRDFDIVLSILFDLIPSFNSTLLNLTLLAKALFAYIVT